MTKKFLTVGGIICGTGIYIGYRYFDNLNKKYPLVSPPRGMQLTALAILPPREHTCIDQVPAFKAKIPAKWVGRVQNNFVTKNKSSDYIQAAYESTLIYKIENFLGNIFGFQNEIISTNDKEEKTVFKIARKLNNSILIQWKSSNSAVKAVEYLADNLEFPWRIMSGGYIEFISLHHPSEKNSDNNNIEDTSDSIDLWIATGHEYSLHGGDMKLLPDIFHYIRYATARIALDQTVKQLQNNYESNFPSIISSK